MGNEDLDGLDVFSLFISWTPNIYPNLRQLPGCSTSHNVGLLLLKREKWRHHQVLGVCWFGLRWALFALLERAWRLLQAASTSRQKDFLRRGTPHSFSCFFVGCFLLGFGWRAPNLIKIYKLCRPFKILRFNCAVDGSFIRHKRRCIASWPCNMNISQGPRV